MTAHRMPNQAMHEPRAKLRSTFGVFAIGAFAAWHASPGSRSLILCLVRCQVRLWGKYVGTILL
jgi:hypothetical protein